MNSIRSHGVAVPSAKRGLCDVTRTIVTYKDNEDTSVTIIVEDRLFQERVVTKPVTTWVLDSEGLYQEHTETVTVTERVYVEIGPRTAFHYKSSEIDYMFSLVGSDILTTGSFTDQLNLNKVSLLLAQTINVAWRSQTNWTLDNGSYEVVSQFTQTD
jgi:hypothetical protein